MAEGMANEVRIDAIREDLIKDQNVTIVEKSEDNVAEEAEDDENAHEEVMERLRREREARAQALTLEIVGDLPYAEVKPPENVLFVCKLNPVTEGRHLISATYKK